MANIIDILSNILSARYGKDVRQSIHDGIRKCYDDGKAGSVDLYAREQLEAKASQKDLEFERARIDNLSTLKEGSTTADAELIDIRVGVDGATYGSAGAAVRKQISVLTDTAATLTQSKADAIVCTASGTIITATDSADAGFEQFRTFGKSVQEKTLGNQLAESYEAGTGVAQYTSVLFVKAELKPSTTYTISFEGTVGNWLYLNEQITAYKQFQVVSGRTVVTFTTVENMDSSNASKYDANKGWIICKNNIVQSEPNVFDNLMLNLGSTALPWEPYTGGIPSPNPEYPQPIVSAGQKLENGIVSDVGISKRLTGKNLLDVSKLDKKTLTTLEVSQEGYIVKIAGNVAYAQSSRIALPLDIVKGNTVFASQDSIEGDGEGRIYLECISPSGTKSASTKDTLSVSLYIPQDATACNVLLMAVGGAASDVDKSNILKGARITLNSDADWEPYTEQTLTLNRVLRGIPVTDASLATYTDKNGQMWCADEIDVERGVLVQRIGEWALLPTSVGGNGWTEHSTGLGHYTKLPTTIESNIVLPASGKTAFALCDIATCTTWSNMLLASGLFALSYDGYIGFEYSGTLEEFKTMLDTEKPVVQYILATPIETTLTDEEIAAYKALHTNKPTTVITNDAGCYMEVEYVADTYTYIDKSVGTLCESALQKAKDSGEFDGKNGVSVTHSWNGTVLTITSASGTSSADLKGEKGDSGGGVTSWNDLEDRPIYTDVGLVEILPETEFVADSNGTFGITENVPVLELGNTYAVNYNGLEYVCVCENTGANEGGVYLGNAKILGGQDTGEPFLLASGEYNGSQLMVVYPGDNPTSVTISINSKSEVQYFDPKYIKDMYYTEGGLVEILPECTPEYSENDGGFIAFTTAIPTVGNAYTIKWNGTEYECVAQDASIMMPGCIVLGNGAIMNDELPTDQPPFIGNNEPFLIMVAEVEGQKVCQAVALDGTTELTLAIYGGGGEVVHKLDEKYLPDSLMQTIAQLQAEIEALKA